MFVKSKLIMFVLKVFFCKIAYDRQYQNYILDLILNPSEKAVLSMANEGYLFDIGWFNAYNRKEAVGKSYEPIPWLTYPAIEFINQRLKPNMEIFEFGAGNSTLYYATRVASVTAVEHDASWFDKIKSNLPANVNLLYKELKYDGDYCRAALVNSKTYDMVIVDGRDRVNCLKNSLQALAQNGVVILDDSQREEYEEGKVFLAENGFRSVDFWGINPANTYNSCTTVFYKTENCFGL